MFSRLRVPLCCPGDQLPGLAIVTDGARATPENRVEALESGWIEIAPKAAPGGGRFDSRAKCCRRKRMLLIAPCQAGTTTSSGLDADALLSASTFGGLSVENFFGAHPKRKSGAKIRGRRADSTLVRRVPTPRGYAAPGYETRQRGGIVPCGGCGKGGEAVRQPKG